MHTTLMCRAKQALWSAQHSVCIPPLNFVRKTVITKCCTVCFGAQQPQEGSETWVTANKVGCTSALAGSEATYGASQALSHRSNLGGVVRGSEVSDWFKTVEDHSSCHTEIVIMSLLAVTPPSIVVKLWVTRITETAVWYSHVCFFTVKSTTKCMHTVWKLTSRRQRMPLSMNI